MKKEKVKEEKGLLMKNNVRGITLIALVITIIVLLTLAGVSIATLTGPNGLLTRANDAKTEMGKAGAKEKVQVEVAGSYDNSGNLSKDMLNKNLENVEGLTSGTPITGFPATVVVDGYDVTIDGNGKVTTEGETTNPDEPNSPTGDVVTIPPTTAVDKETIFQDSSSGNKEAVIPEGFKVSEVENEQKIDKGLVVIAPDGSEFVWVPVDKTGLCVDGIADKEVAELPEGETVNYRGQLYDFSGTTSSKRVYSETSYREPAYLTDSYGGDASDFNTIGITQELLQEEYNGIIKSIKEHGGFYIGRYESSLTSNTTGHIQSKKGIEPVTSASYNKETKTWYGLYQKQKEYATVISQSKVKSGMIYGSMYDAVMNWALSDESEKNKVTAASTSHDLQATGLATEDVIKNIYDLGNNIHEWTAEASSTSYRVIRGGYNFYPNPPSYRVYDWPCNEDADSGGSRLLLYL